MSALPPQAADAARAPATAPRTADARGARLMRLATYASVGVAGTLIVVKFAAWLLTESVSLLSTLIDSLLDAAASLVNLLAVRHALEPADREHRFGHGKAEPLAGLAQAAFIAGSALFLVFQAIERLARPKAVAHTEIGYAVLVLAIAMTVALVAFQHYVVRRTGSMVIDADSLHYKSDILVNGSVMVSLFLSTNFGWREADPLFAIGIAAFIVWGSFGIGRDSLHMLMDRELPEADRRKILDIARAHPEVRGVHDLRTRAAGQQVFIQLHLELDGETRLKDVHVTSELVMAEIERAFPNAEVIIHEDPEGVDEPRKVFT